MMEDGVDDIADDPHELEVTARGMNEHYLEVATRESYKGRELLAAVSSGIRRLKGKTVREDEPGIPAEYAFEDMRYRQAIHRTADSSAMIGSIAFNGLEHEEQGEYWYIDTEGVPDMAQYEMIFFRNRPVLARWQYSAPGPRELMEQYRSLELPDKLLNTLTDTYNDRRDPDAYLQEAYFEHVGTPKETAVDRVLQLTRLYIRHQLRRISSDLQDIHTPSPDELRLVADKLNTLRNT